MGNDSGTIQWLLWVGFLFWLSRKGKKKKEVEEAPLSLETEGSDDHALKEGAPLDPFSSVFSHLPSPSSSDIPPAPLEVDQAVAASSMPPHPEGNIAAQEGASQVPLQDSVREEETRKDVSCLQTFLRDKEGSDHHQKLRDLFLFHEVMQKPKGHAFFKRSYRGTAREATVSKR